MHLQPNSFLKYVGILAGNARFLLKYFMKQKHVILALLWPHSHNRKEFGVWGTDTFPGGDVVMREVRVYGSVHEDSQVSGRKPLGFLSYALQVKVRGLVYTTAQFIFHNVIQNLKSLFLGGKNTKFRLLIFQWYISLVICHLAMRIWPEKRLTRQVHRYVNITECIYRNWDVQTPPPPHMVEPAVVPQALGR